GVDRLRLTPHLAASTQEAQDRTALEICQAVLEALDCGDFAGAVNVTGVSSEAMRRLRPLQDLARCVGRLGALLAQGRISEVEVEYGGTDEQAPRVAKLAAVEGLLAAMGVGPVTVVNAQPLAEERGMRLSRRKAAPVPGYETTVTVTLRGAGTAISVAGALVGERGRIVLIDGFAVDVPAEGQLIVMRNLDVPGVIGRVGSVLGEAGTNIGVYHQSRRPSDGTALAAIAVDQPPGAEVVARLAALPDVTDVRVVALDTEA
ncbi:MAG: hypothetical protein OEW06_10670, partial [Gemmatimonadota bacterium]|nr:hypothetical protein [Gemmatimonadota bacterium]